MIPVDGETRVKDDENPYLNKQNKNTGLLYQKYLHVYSNGKNKFKIHQNALAKISNYRKDLSLEHLKGYYSLHFKSLESFGFKHDQVETQSRLLCGVGNASVVEGSGFFFHPLYGFPIIPASSIKGLLRHYFLENFGNENFDLLVFGNTSKRGVLNVADAWIDLNSKDYLYADVLTPHYKNYYESASPPSDFKPPHPHSFLSIKSKQTFHFWIKIDIEHLQTLLKDLDQQYLQETISKLQKTYLQNKEEICDTDKNQVQKSLEEILYKMLYSALHEWGIGAKTGSNYGYFSKKELNDEH